MALPGDVTSFTLTFGPYTDASGEPVLAGTTGKIRPSVSPIRHAASGSVVIDSPIPVVIDAFGMASVELAHTAQAVLSPNAFTYTVVWDVASRKPSPGNKQISVLPTDGDTIDFDLLGESADVEGVHVPSALSVNGKTGVVVLTASDVGAVATTGLDAASAALVDNAASATGARLRAALEARSTKPAVSFSPLPALLDGRYNYNAVPFIQDNLWTVGDTQIAVFWDTQARPFITKRTLPDGPWATPTDLSLVAGNPLASPAEADAHNTLAVGVDPAGYVHVIGNQHGDVLRYVKSTNAGLNISTFAAATMTGVAETSMTYPQFFATNDGTLFFIYRDGGSGNGNEMIRKLVDSTWTDPVGGVLINGAVSSENPYMQHVSTDSNGIHLMWCWREDSTNAGSNTDLSYARSADGGVTWRGADGTALALPITHATAAALAREIPINSGLVNQNGSCVDRDGHPHAAYTQYDGNGKMQIAHTWHNGTAWQHELVTTKLTHRMEVVSQGLIDASVSRPSIVSGADGRTWIIFRTLFDGRRGTVRAVEATPGAVNRQDFSILDVDVWEWEPSYDTQAAKNRDELHMLVGPSLNNAQASPGYNAADNWQRQYGAVLTIDLAQMGQIRAGRVRVPRMQTLGTAGAITSSVTAAGTSDADVPGVGTLLAPKYLPRQGGKVLFGRWRARMNTVTASGQTGTFKLKLTDGGAVVMAGSLIATSSGSILKETPWLPFPEWPLNDTLSWVGINGKTTDAAGTRFTILTLELGYVDF